VDLTVIVIAAPVLLASLTLHEVAHGFAADALGDPTARSEGRLTLNPLKHLDPLGTLVLVVTLSSGKFLFGWAKPVPVDPRHFRSERRGMMLVGAAGPIMNLALAIASGLAVRFCAPWSQTAALVFFYVFYLNMILALFNILPIPPLDGSRVLGGFLPPSAYEMWRGLDRFGNLAIIGLLAILYTQPGLFRGYVEPPLQFAARVLMGVDW
jgi:Zn-dependent protease